jgi:diguanylate cyclase (GGDEF)-like protein/PAS domain S-box-containing protein
MLRRLITRLFRKQSSPASEGTAMKAIPVEVDYRSMMEHSLDMICHVRLINGKIKFTYTSPACGELLGWSCEEFLGLSAADIFTNESMAIIGADIAKIKSGFRTSSVLVEAVRKDGQHIWLENKVRVIEGETAGVTTVIVSMRDVTERKSLQDRLEKQAMMDGLTGISNRRAFGETLEREWNRAVRTGGPLSLVMIDVDRFKLMNDAYGHQVGDECLRAVAVALRMAVKRSTDFVARYGGEEFVALLPGTDMAGAAIVAHEIREAVEGLRFPHAETSGGVVTVSCGVSTGNVKAGSLVITPEILINSADIALYKAKLNGRNRVNISLALSADWLGSSPLEGAVPELVTTDSHD